MKFEIIQNEIYLKNNRILATKKKRNIGGVPVSLQSYYIRK